MKLTMIQGQCLCGDTKFLCNFLCDSPAASLKMYQCHCSLCKKKSGSSSNSATIVKVSQFKWIKQDKIKRWQKQSGLVHAFCKNCGCPVPKVWASDYYWIPMGLLEFDDSSPDIKVVAHFCLSTKSSWHIVDIPNTKRFDNFPNMEVIQKLLS